MDKYEIIFIILAIIAYIICTVILNISTYVHIIFGALILICLLIAIILKYQQKVENKKIVNFMKILEIIIIICYFITLINELFITNRINHSQIFFILFFIVFFFRWFFGKNEK